MLKQNIDSSLVLQPWLKNTMYDHAFLLRTVPYGILQYLTLLLNYKRIL
jgi:hypothetical protein